MKVDQRKGEGMNALGHVRSTHKTQIAHRQPTVGYMNLARGTQPGSAADAASTQPGGNVDRAGASAMFPATMPGDQTLKGGFNS